MSKQSHISPGPKSFAAPSVIVVSEDAMQSHLLGSLLEHLGVQVLEARSVEQALLLIGGPGTVNAIVIDWDIQGESGKRFCQFLKGSSEQARRAIPIIALSSQSGFGEIKDLSQFGVKATLTFPINPQRFLSCMDQVLYHGRSAKSSTRVLIASTIVSQVDPLCRSLQERGWTVHVTTNADETRRMLKELCPDLVLLYHPVSDEMGLGLVDDIKLHHAEIVVFLVSTQDSPSFAVEALQHGVDEVIRSPLTGQYIHALWEKYRRLHSLSLRSEMESETSKARAFHDQASIARLAGEIAHDINNVLTSILGHAGMLNQRSSVRNSVRRSTHVIEQAARRGQELTAKLVGAVKPKRERRESVNLCEIVKEVLDLVQPETNYSVHVEQRFQASDNWVRGDELELHQIFLNLIMNACEAMPQGGELIVETQMTVVDANGHEPQKSIAPGQYLELIVRDSGSGIPEDVLPHIFEVFFSTKGQGTGIGLATVRDVVQKNGGTVTVESQVACGTSFHVFLPQRAGESISGERNSSIQEKRHMLVVDDDPAVGQTVAEILEFLGHEVTVVDKGQAAIDFVRAQTDLIDVVFLDLAMEPMDGPTCFRAIRILNPAIPVVLTSGYAQNPEVQQLLEEGLAGFVGKPYDVQELSAVLAQVYRSPCPQSHRTLSIPGSVVEKIA